MHFVQVALAALELSLIVSVGSQLTELVGDGAAYRWMCIKTRLNNVASAGGVLAGALQVHLILLAPQDMLVTAGCVWLELLLLIGAHGSFVVFLS